VVPWRGNVHDAIDDQRRRLEAVEHAGLERPFRHELLDVLVVDLIERAEPRAAVIASIRQPRRAIVGRFEQFFRSHLRRGEWRSQRNEECDAQSKSDELAFHEGLLPELGCGNRGSAHVCRDTGATALD